jgi:hypothetical protein
MSRAVRSLRGPAANSRRSSTDRSSRLRWYKRQEIRETYRRERDEEASSKKAKEQFVYQFIPSEAGNRALVKSLRLRPVCQAKVLWMFVICSILSHA